jgi:hypothetical protein
MATSMRVEDRLEGSGNFRSWKHRLQMILDENDLLEHVTVGVPEPDEEEKKTKHKKNEKKSKENRVRFSEGSLDPSYIRTTDSKENV